MSFAESEYGTPIPFLARYAAARTPSPEIQGHYSSQAAMWVIDQNGVENPLIDLAHGDVELVTKTMVQHESDDETTSWNMAELVTKTDARPEQDDVGFFAGMEMATKTEAQLEHDDTSPETTGLFL